MHSQMHSLGCSSEGAVPWYANTVERNEGIGMRVGLTKLLQNYWKDVGILPVSLFVCASIDFHVCIVSDLTVNESYNMKSYFYA